MVYSSLIKVNCRCSNKSSKHLANKMAPAAAPPSKHPRPGYVTLPRKPRVSSNGPQGLILKDRESYHIYDQLGRKDYVQEPIYDGIGPRLNPFLFPLLALYN